MRFWNVIGTVTRYVLAAVACISIAQFLLLLNVGTENSGRLAGQSLARGVISGLVAAVWFYRARKACIPVPANVPTQVRVAALPKSLEQPAAPPIETVSVAPTAPIPTTNRLTSSFWENENNVVIVILVAAAAIILFILMGKGMFQLPWTLSAGASQPRFVHVQGTPSAQMVDTKTGQVCVATPIAYDSLNRVRADFRKVFYEEAEHDQVLRVLAQHEELVSQAVDTLDSADSDQHYNSPAFQELYRRYDALKANPEHPPVYHIDGMPYCKEL